eukprot:gene32366-5057_t
MSMVDKVVAWTAAALAYVLNPDRVKEGISVGLSNAGVSASDIARIQDAVLASMPGVTAATPIAGADGGKKKRKLKVLAEKRLAPVSYYAIFSALFSKRLNKAYAKHPEAKPKTTQRGGNLMLRCSGGWKEMDMEEKKKFEETFQPLKDVLNAEAKTLGRRDFNLVERIAEVELDKVTKKWLKGVMNRSVAAALEAVQARAEAEAEDAATAALKNGNGDEDDIAEVEEPQPPQKKAKLSSSAAKKQVVKPATPQLKASSSEEEEAPKRKAAAAKSPANVATKSSTAVAKSPANVASKSSIVVAKSPANVPLKSGAAVAKRPAKVEARKRQESSDQEEEKPPKISKKAAKSSEKAAKSPVKAGAGEAGSS